VRWKTRREVIGMWRATAGDWKFFKGYTYLWEFGFRHIVWLNESCSNLSLASRPLQAADAAVPATERLRHRDSRPQARRNYHPIYGSHADPYQDTRWNMLKQRLPFPCASGWPYHRRR